MLANVPSMTSASCAKCGAVLPPEADRCPACLLVTERTRPQSPKAFLSDRGVVQQVTSTDRALEPVTAERPAPVDDGRTVMDLPLALRELARAELAQPPTETAKELAPVPAAAEQSTVLDTKALVEAALKPMPRPTVLESPTLPLPDLEPSMTAETSGEAPMPKAAPSAPPPPTAPSAPVSSPRPPLALDSQPGLTPRPEPATRLVPTDQQRKPSKPVSSGPVVVPKARAASVKVPELPAWQSAPVLVVGGLIILVLGIIVGALIR